MLRTICKLKANQLVDGTTSSSVESKGTVINLSVFEEDSNLSIHTIDQTVNSNSVIGVATDALKAFRKSRYWFYRWIYY